jgi:1-acyl-sn-glycerol-3-phosphate acyltransferase
MKGLLYFPRSLLFTTFMAITVFAYAFWITVTVPFKGRQYGYHLAVQWVRVLMWLLKHICKLDYRVSGVDNIPSEASVVYLKHSSAWEALAELLIFPEQAWVLKKEIRWIPFVGTGVVALNSIAIDRKSGRQAVRQVIEQGKQRLKKGYFVMIFPEGTRVPNGQSGRYGASGALLAIEAGVPLVPVSHNAGYFWPRRSWIKWPGTIDMVIGKPISTAGRTPQEVNQLAREWIEDTLKTLPKPDLD